MLFYNSAAYGRDTSPSNIQHSIHPLPQNCLSSYTGRVLYNTSRYIYFDNLLPIYTITSFYIQPSPEGSNSLVVLQGDYDSMHTTLGEAAGRMALLNGGTPTRKIRCNGGTYSHSSPGETVCVRERTHYQYE